MNASLISMAFITGLMGAGHCIGMCGGLVSALSLSEVGQKGGWKFHLVYNVGRITTYTFIGAVVGWLGSAMAYTDQFKVVTRSLLLASDLFIILVGLGTAGLFSWLNASKLGFPGPIQTMTSAVHGLRKLPPALAALPLGPALWLHPLRLPLRRSNHRSPECRSHHRRLDVAGLRFRNSSFITHLRQRHPLVEWPRPYLDAAHRRFARRWHGRH